MPRKEGKIPVYGLHKATGQGVVRLSGKDHYLGKHGTAESRARYDALIASWLAAGRNIPTTEGTIGRLVARYLVRVEKYYRKAGRPTTTVATAKAVCKELVASHGGERVKEFDAAKFKAMRAVWVARDLAFNSVSRYCERLTEVFRWGVEEGLVPVDVLQQIKAVAGLRRGRGQVRETSPVRPVPDTDIEAVLAAARPKLAAVIRLQLLTGMRPGEVCSMRPADIDRSGDVWLYTPPSHKTEHHGKARVIALGPRAMAEIMPHLDDSRPRGLIFDRLSVRSYTIANPKDRFAPGRLYYNAVRRICIKLGIPPWHPHQLRHNAATRMRKDFGLELTRIILGHSSIAMTEIYAEADLEKVIAAAAKIG